MAFFVEPLKLRIYTIVIFCLFKSYYDTFDFRFRDICHGHALGGYSQQKANLPYHMILTIDNTTFSGMVIDGVGRKSKVHQ